MALSKTKLPLLSFITAALFLILLANKVHSQDHIDFQFDTFPSESPDLTYQGDAYVPSGSEYLRLTKTDSNGNPASGSVGRVVYSTPIQFWEPGRQSTFETTIRFVITPVNNDPADGIAFFIAPVNSTLGSSGGSLGIFGPSGTASNLFAVEFDSYVNGAWDPSYRHIGIDINSRTSRNTTRFEVFRQVVTARINYNSNTRVISVVATAGSETTTLTYVFDLKTVLPQRVEVGISASTGQEVAIHDILTWYFSSTLVYDGNGYDNLNSRKIVDKYIHQFV